MPSIAEIQRKLKAFDTFARRSDDVSALRKKWHTVFGTELTEVSAKSFATHYREMRSKNTRGRKVTRRSRKQRGGIAPLSYVMTPGADVSVYGRFPVEVDTDPGSIKDLDVYFQDALTLGCGKNTEFWPTVPQNMGSNKVGGRRTNRNRKGRKGRKGRNGRKTLHRKQRGGNVLDTIGGWIGNGFTTVTGLNADDASRPMFATAPPNAIQSGYTTYTGMAPPPAPEPEKRAWDFQSKGTAMAISPQHVARISADFNDRVSPPIYSK